jgi:hypothetical protein
MSRVRPPSETRSIPFFTDGGNCFARFDGDNFTGASFGGGATLVVAVAV